MQCQLNQLRKAGDIDDPQQRVDRDHHHRDHDEDGADEDTVLVDLRRRTGEPQRRSDEPADRRSGQRHRDSTHARFDEQTVERTHPVDHAGGELRCQPGQVRCGGEGQCAERTDDVAVQGLPLTSPRPPGHQRGNQHEQHAAQRHRDPVTQNPLSGDTRTQRDTVGTSDGSPGQQRPPDSQDDAQRRRQRQRGAWKIAKRIGFAEVEHEQQGETERGDRDERSRHPQQRRRDQGGRQQPEAHQEHCARPRIQMREQRTGQRRRK